MTDNHRSVIGDITHGPEQCREAGSWRERHLKNETGTKLRAQFIFDASTRAQIRRIACHRGCSVTSLIKEAPSAERRITHQLSGKALNQYYDGEKTNRHPRARLSGITRTTRCTDERTGHIAIHRAVQA